MFKDARLQERLFDQIHAGEFNLKDDFRTAEVGSVFPVRTTATTPFNALTTAM